MFDQEIYEYEVSGLVEKYKKYKKRKLNRHAYKKYVVLTNGTTIEDTLIPSLNGTGEESSLVLLSDEYCYTEAFLQNSLENKIIDINELEKEEYENTCFLFLLDAQKDQERVLKIIDIVCKKLELCSNFLVMCLVNVDIPCATNGILSFAEREFSYVKEVINGNKNDVDVLIEDKLRRWMKGHNDNVSMARVGSVFGSTGYCSRYVNIDELIKTAFKTGKLEIVDADVLEEYSFGYSPDIALSVRALCRYAKRGHIYNLSGYNISKKDIKNQILNLYKKELQMSMNCSCEVNSARHCLGTMKFNHEFGGVIKNYRTFGDAMFLTTSGVMGREYDVNRVLGVYQGKLQRIKDLEMDILAEVDRICKKYDIHYFLTAGSLLGALRNNKSIAWDDDLDLGMLREDFEKFRKYAPGELNPKYNYSSWIVDDNVHYYFDKIRLRGTYFSTYYSNKFVLEDGVFVDFIIYDQTANSKVFQNWHIKIMKALYYFLSVKWQNTTVKKHHKLSVVALPILRILPYKFVHKVYDFYAKLYFNDKHRKYLIDGGTHKEKGAFPRDFLSETIETDFDGVKVPIPVHAHEFMEFFYGKDYLSKPPISMRVGAHKIARMDLGKYLYENNPEKEFRLVDVRGELFEDEL